MALKSAEPLDALKLLHEQQQLARTAEINDVMRLENILATGRENKVMLIVMHAVDSTDTSAAQGAAGGGAPSSRDGGARR